MLCVEALDDAFVNAFWQFIKDGGYQQQEKSNGAKNFYRFLKPQAEGYPAMLELFSRQPDGIPLGGEAHLAPIPVGEEASSLSAILLDADYYRLLHSRKRKLEGVSLVDEACLLLLKARAWLDLAHRRANGEKIDSRTISKHRNDVLRVFQLFAPTSRIPVPGRIHEDLTAFLDAVSAEMDAPLLKNLGIKEATPVDLVAAIRASYVVNDPVTV